MEIKVFNTTSIADDSGAVVAYDHRAVAECE